MLPLHGNVETGRPVDFGLQYLVILVPPPEFSLELLKLKNIFRTLLSFHGYII